MSSDISRATDSYGQRFVGFVDILGFGDLVRRADGNAVLRTQIIEALRTVGATKAPSSGATDLHVQNFSDSLILSTLPTPDGLWHLLLSLDGLAWSLLQMGVLMRGGVSIGGMHHDDEIVFGTGVIDAYRLESAVAKYPRIIISKAVLARADDFAGEAKIWDALRQARLRRDRDGVWFLHYFNELASANVHSRAHLEPGTDAWLAAGQALQRTIQQMLEVTVDAPDIYEKVRWLGDYWNREVVGASQSEHESNFERVTLAGEEPRWGPLPFRPGF